MAQRLSLWSENLEKKTMVFIGFLVGLGEGEILTNITLVCLDLFTSVASRPVFLILFGVK